MSDGKEQVAVKSKFLSDSERKTTWSAQKCSLKNHNWQPPLPSLAAAETMHQS